MFLNHHTADSLTVADIDLHPDMLLHVITAGFGNLFMLRLHPVEIVVDAFVVHSQRKR